MGLHIDELETPTVLIDIDRVGANLDRFQAFCDTHRLAARPHIKTHKLPLLAQQQVARGAVGITCQKLGEAEVMAAAGLTDIFLPYNLIGSVKLQRAVALAKQITLSLTVDDLRVAAPLSAAFAAAGLKVEVLVECDTGMHRCGVTDPAAAAELARAISALPGIDFGGLMTFPAPGTGAAAAAWLDETKRLLARDGLDCRRISSGGSPDMWHAHEGGVATEHRAGTYVYYDRSLVEYGTCTPDDCALTVLTTVVSTPAPDRIVVDAGSKTLTSDTLGLDGHGLVVDYPDLRVGPLSEEHGVIAAGVSDEMPALTERLRIVPNHACVVSNMVDRVHLIRGDRVEQTVPVAARGRID